MPSDDVEDRILAAHALKEMIEQLSEPLAAGMAERLLPHLRPGETLPDLVLVQRLLGRLVMHRLETLIAADEEYLRRMAEPDDDRDD